MELSCEVNPLLEALGYLGARANGCTLRRLGERLQARSADYAARFAAESAPLEQLTRALDAEVDIPEETLTRLFGDIKGFPYNTIGSYSPAFLLVYPLLGRSDEGAEAVFARLRALTPDEAAGNIMTTLSLNEQESAGGSTELVARVLALTIPSESRLALLELHQNYRALLPEIIDCLSAALRALHARQDTLRALGEQFQREVAALGCEDYLRQSSSLALTPGQPYHLLPFLLGPDTNLSIERRDGSTLIYCGVLRLALRRILAANSDHAQTFDVLRVMGDRTRFDILCYLCEHPASYGQQLCERFGLAKNTIHHHMSKLVNAGLVSCAVEGNRVYYTADRERLARTLRSMHRLLLGTDGGAL